MTLLLITLWLNGRPLDHEPTPMYCAPLFALHGALGEGVRAGVYVAVNRVCGDF